MDILFGASLISEMKLHYRLGLSGENFSIVFIVT